MPDLKSNACVIFDREIIRSKITKLSYKDARRMQGPIYDVLLKELLEEGCSNTYKYIECLLIKEEKLVTLNYTSQRLRAEPEFLIAVVENLKLAELSIKLSNGGGWLAALKILYQTMLMTQSHLAKYEWFVSDIFEIVINIMKGLDNENPCYNELKMRIYYRYALNLRSRDRHVTHAIEYFFKAFELAKGESWAPDSMPEMERFNTMYEAIPHLLAKILILRGKKLLYTHPEEALAMAKQAVGVLSAVSWKENKFLACKAILTKVFFLIECLKFELALSLINKIQPYITREVRSEFFRMQCEIFLYRGQCFYNLNDSQLAMEAYRTGYMLSRKYNSREMQADFLLNIGRAYGKNRKKLIIAIDAYTAARKIFDDHSDYQNKMKTTYLLAKLKTDQIFSQFMSLVKSKNYCEYYKLRQWKNQCKPFWKIEPETIIRHAPKQPSNLSQVYADASKKTILDEDGELNESDDSSEYTELGVRGGIESEFSMEQFGYMDSARRTTDFFGVREDLMLKSSNWGDTLIGESELGYRENLDCLLHEFENVESKS